MKKRKFFTQSFEPVKECIWHKNGARKKNRKPVEGNGGGGGARGLGIKQPI